MNLFYAPDIAESPFLPEEESLHCVKVLRMKAGDHIHVIDGVGGLYEAEITEAHHKRTQLALLNVTRDYGRRPFRLHLAVAPTKNIDRFEWFVEKATEIGFDELTPLECRFSERRVVKLERIQKILVSASKQSLKAFIPKLNPMTPYKEFMAGVSESQRFIAHCYDQPKVHLLKACKPLGDVVVMVGPEGDFSEPEVDLALKNAFKAVTLSDARLRTETAGVVACHLVNIANL